MSRVHVGDADSFEDGSRAVVTVNGHEVAVLNYDGEYFAILNRCAHDGGALDEGKVHERLVADVTEPGERDVERFCDDPAVTCPLHGWEYDLETGVHVGDESIRLPTFDVVDDDGELFVVDPTTPES
ncbi:Rieske (2Fe-2S) protein [Halobellus sp. Atlit-38R]|uniref:Rieske (2Fe-2S) protein n=1 Tax=Halobellus sp. Atlit-38R TaxID=2282131 RepID=UPI000EF28E02|nr:Rieske (2Fe-2S) protein [Halobellus sp. Atlit-38R]RLM90332.1 Rieske (2Fe-2S) protein [Halobellus sp. Atlit-38R]